MIIILKASARQLEYSDTLIDDVVDLASNGQEALEKVEERFNTLGTSYSLIMTDISMPIMDGFETAKVIRQFHSSNRLKQPTIIACSGHTEQSYIEKAWIYEFDEFLSKPLKIDVTKEILEEFITLC